MQLAIRLGGVRQRKLQAAIPSAAKIRREIGLSAIAVAHNTHHATARHNYGLYFLWWDRWMGTLDPAYDCRYDMGRPRDSQARQPA
jgi:sterol desaturase/sphingolipid hydroxylase (fatty acid hydroxylase superfamily)